MASPRRFQYEIASSSSSSSSSAAARFGARMVFFKKRLSRVVHVHPMFLGARLREHIKLRAQEDVQAAAMGTVSGMGFVVLVLKIEDDMISEGKIDHLTGLTRFDVSYDAIVFRPFRNEVLDAVTKVCTTQGVFAEAGPLDIFVSRHYIPPEYEFRADDASWASTETGVVIRAGAEMRVKVLGANATGAVAAIGTINEPHLGPQ